MNGRKEVRKIDGKKEEMEGRKEGTKEGRRDRTLEIAL